MKRTAIGLFVAAFACVSGERANACPYCNIYNRLAKEVQESTDVYLGEVLRPVGSYRAEVRVLKVLRGAYNVGSTVTSDVFRPRLQIGKQFIFCDRDSRSSTNGALEVEIEDEILFLLRGKPEIRSMEEAVRRVQGVSVETHKKGMEYIAEHHADAVKPLIREMNLLIPQVLSAEEVFYGEHRLANLAEALVIEPTDEVRAFVFSQIDAFPSQQASPFEWHAWLPMSLGAIGVSLAVTGLLWIGTRVFFRSPSSRRQWPSVAFVVIPPIIVMAYGAWNLYQLLAPWIAWIVFFSVIIGGWLLLAGLLRAGTRAFLRRPFPSGARSLLLFVTSTSAILVCAVWYCYPVPQGPSSHGVFLKDLLKPTTKHQELLTAVSEHVLDECSKRTGCTLADAVYAIVLAGVATPDQLEAKLASEESADMLALGLYWAGNERSLWWDMDHAHNFWGKSLSVARTRRLKTAISHEIRANPRRHP